ncbi:hypothetical protein ACFX1Z_022804 [Malus domestica]
MEYAPVRLWLSGHEGSQPAFLVTASLREYSRRRSCSWRCGRENDMAGQRCCGVWSSAAATNDKGDSNGNWYPSRSSSAFFNGEFLSDQLLLGIDPAAVKASFCAALMVFLA